MGITVSSINFTGDKIKLDRILNREITVHDYKIEDSTAKPGTKYVNLQIEVNGQMHVCFTSGRRLMEMIQQVKRTDLPFKTIIIKENESPIFS